MTRQIDIHTLIAASPRILVLLWGVTLPFCAFAGWLFVFLANANTPLAATVLAGSFLLMGCVVFAGTAELTLHYLRHDALRLTLIGEAPAVGKRLDGIIDLPASAASAWVGVVLACVQVSRERIGADRTIAFEKDCWSDRRQFAVQRSGRRRSAVVRFEIPDFLPPSSHPPAAGVHATSESGRDRYFWELRIDAGGARMESRRALGIHILPAACRSDPAALEGGQRKSGSSNDGSDSQDSG